MDGGRRGGERRPPRRTNPVCKVSSGHPTAVHGLRAVILPLFMMYSPFSPCQVAPSPHSPCNSTIPCPSSLPSKTLCLYSSIPTRPIPLLSASSCPLPLFPLQFNHSFSPPHFPFPRSFPLAATTAATTRHGKWKWSAVGNRFQSLMML